jgi:hypothetical protein
MPLTGASQGRSGQSRRETIRSVPMLSRVRRSAPYAGRERRKAVVPLASSGSWPVTATNP